MAIVLDPNLSINPTIIYTGDTAGEFYTFHCPINVNSAQTLVIFIASNDTGLTNIQAPNVWNKISEVSGGTGYNIGTFLSYWYQGDADHDTVWTFSGLSNGLSGFSCGYGIVLNNCVVNDGISNFVINASGSTYFPAAGIGPYITDKFETTINKTFIIQAVAMFDSYSSSSVSGGTWSSNPELEWINYYSDIVYFGKQSTIKSVGTRNIIQGLAYAFNCPINIYNNSYILGSSHDSMTINVAVTPKYTAKPNQVLNIVEGFNSYYL